MTVDTEISIVSAVVNSVLAVLTGIYVLFTYALLRQAREAAAKSERLFNSQMLISTMPYLELRVQKSEQGSLLLHLTNWGQNPALDIDLWFVCTYDRNEAKSLKARAEPKCAKKLKADPDGIYYVFERATHPGIAGGHRLIDELGLPFTSSIHCFLQYRTCNGVNLWKYVWVFESMQKGRSSFLIGSSIPNEPIPAERADYRSDTDGRFRFVSADPALRNESLLLDFVQAFEQATTWTPKDATLPEVEDRGKVEKVN